MAVDIKLLPEGIVKVFSVTKTLSGQVKVNDVPAERRILVYRMDRPNLFAEGWSDPITGNWSIEINTVGDNDRYRIICVGEVGENAGVYENVAAI